MRQLFAILGHKKKQLHAFLPPKKKIYGWFRITRYKNLMGVNFWGTKQVLYLSYKDLNAWPF